MSFWEMHLPLRRRLQRNWVLFLLAMMLAFSIYQLLCGPKIHSAPWTASQPEDQVKVTTRDLSSNKVAASGSGTTASKIRHCVYVDPTSTMPITSSVNATPPLGSVNLTHLDEEGSYPTPPSHGEYPQDLFSLEQRRKGWVILHIFGMMYVFVALAIVCDEYFVPALDVITEKLQISDDVAGATFMAAGGSAPELFTSLIGVFISHSNVGIGTIVGSAVFNILFVIGTCALFSREILHLTWWPLFRDVSFYILDLLMLILFFLDSFIVWWESILLLSAYALYVLTMKWNIHLEQWVKEQVNKTRNTVKAAASEDTKKQGNGSVARDGAKHSDDSKRLELMPSLQRGGSSASLHNSHMRTTIFQLMIHTLDPLAEAKFKDTLDIMSNLATGKLGSQVRQGVKAEAENKAEAELATTVQVTPASDSNLSVEEDEHSADTPPGGQLSPDIEGSSSEEEEDCDDDSEDEEEENDEPLSLKWPETRRKQAIYLFLLPVVFPLWLTVPDVRNPRSRNFFAITFLGAIAWIAAFSYLMVWWAHQVGETIGISEEIMGLTILAAGTSIPDLITSVIVARKGLGDMAVSSSVGSNIFDITVGLPVPWFLYSIFNGLSPVAVSSNGLFCAIVLLFLMLLFVIISIALSKWKMNKLLGLTMFALYFVFLIISVMLEDRIISCPISV
ncbi:sodium/potassium/calcium exchanger 1 isoform X1 [Gopherus evgoodei]|uniref:sodium/potassium/calcium exchanger 1 isoform X1 n=1 Tax=Gopherus evgoodei TaxID=1825980 RepID=UPI0011CEF8C8|nr:sodium/potassium/calcium exchanger 1 isoform X1 [Gopherus evgoodei]XP_030433390.1 sodium/potassium/calcium exchanger 1 isoform X1 [Gopherus evgoodei]XP_030433391.1 sodium/potassium/calcium exchanger 1 isoform X1 [Gopherus evgoodei]XP_030433392.1 sodium/potassium/calcium exchanger 1 isoform X1 [Gopherus evgoodei]